MTVRKHIPNAITCLSLASGCIACVAALDGRLSGAAIWIIIAAVFDFLDGFAARLLKAYSPMGKELDSLSDMVSFGVAPGMVVFHLLREACLSFPPGLPAYIPYLAFVIPVFSGLRLAKFNLDARQTTSFIGLPVPAHALFWSSLAYSLQPVIHHLNQALFAALLILSATLTSLLLVSELPMFSLKVKSPAWKGNEVRYILAGCAILFVILFGFLGISGAICLYVLLSAFSRKS
jgi:CDP-diacylglycerol--serine O-phosphatidyltransferase